MKYIRNSNFLTLKKKKSSNPIEMDLRPEERYFSKEAYIQQIITWKDIQGNTKTNAKPNHNERLYTFQNGLRLKKK